MPINSHSRMYINGRFTFSGWKDSFFGTLHAQSGHSVEFYTQTKVVVERWLEDWSRQF